MPGRLSGGKTTKWPDYILYMKEVAQPNGVHCAVDLCTPLFRTVRDERLVEDGEEEVQKG